MISLTDTDKRFYSENAPALLGYMKYVEYVIENREMFGGTENVTLALQIGKLIGRNEIDPNEFKELKAGIKRICKSTEKACRVTALLENSEKFQELIRAVIETNPKAFLIVAPSGEILMDSKGNPVPNLMKVSLAIARELEHDI